MIGERLAEVRKDHGDTQETLGARLGVTKFTVSNWEQGKSEPGHDDLVRLCRLYSVSADYLLGISNDDPVYDRQRRALRFTREEQEELRNMEKYLLWKRKNSTTKNG